MREDESGNLVLADGTVIPADQRTRPEIYSRCCGYLRPVEMWNVGKQEEFHDRKRYDIGAQAPWKGAVGCGCGTAAGPNGIGVPQGQTDEAGAQPTS